MTVEDVYHKQSLPVTKSVTEMTTCLVEEIINHSINHLNAEVEGHHKAVCRVSEADVNLAAPVHDGCAVGHKLEPVLEELGLHMGHVLKLFQCHLGEEQMENMLYVMQTNIFKSPQVINYSELGYQTLSWDSVIIAMEVLKAFVFQ